MTTSDADLVKAAQEGNREAWSALCHRHARRLCAYLGSRLRRPKVVEKIVEDAIVTSWRHLNELSDANDFPAWFRRVGANLALRWFREHSEEKLSEPFPMERCGGDVDVATAMARLEVALGNLTDPQRMALESHFRGGMDGDVLWESLHLDKEAGGRLLEEALQALDKSLDGETPGT
jgi:RNA polymerase sigma-70 factor, ECF subfamily